MSNIVMEESTPKPSSLLPFNLKKCLSSNDILTPPQSPMSFGSSNNRSNINQSPLINPKFTLELISEEESTDNNNNTTTATNNSNNNSPSLTSSSFNGTPRSTSSNSHPLLVPSLSSSSIRYKSNLNNNSNDNKNNNKNNSNNNEEEEEDDTESSSSSELNSTTTSFSSSTTSSNFSLSSYSSNTNDFSPLRNSNPNCHSLCSSGVSSPLPPSTSTVLLRVKLPASHPLITKVLRFPLQFTIKDTLDRIHESVQLENRINLIIIHKQSILPHHHQLSNYFVNDDGILPMIEIKEVTSMSSSTSILGNCSPNAYGNGSGNGSGSANGKDNRPKLLKSSSVQNLMNSMPNPAHAKSKRNSGGKDNLMFQPPPPSYTTELDKLMWISTGSGSNSKSIPCIHQKWSSSSGKQSKLTIIYSGCDREDIGMIRKNIRILSDILQCNIICYDYTGFGLNSSGTPTMKELLGDISIVYNYCIKVLNIPSSNIILMGNSIGTICNLKFAGELFPKQNKNNSNSNNSNNSNSKSLNSTPKKEEEQQKESLPLGGIILISSFGPNGLSENIVNKFLSLDSLNHLKYINRITCPVMIVHGTEDEIVDIKSAKKLSKQFQKLFKYMPIKDANHWNLLDSDFLDDFADEMIEFVKSIAPEQFSNRKERELPRSYAMSPSKVVGSWLDRLELSEYTNSFLQAGYFEMMAIASLDRTMLELLGVEESHIPLLLEEISKISVRYSSGSSSSTLSDCPNSEISTLSTSSVATHFIVSSSSGSSITTSSSAADSDTIVTCSCENTSSNNSNTECDCSSVVVGVAISTTNSVSSGGHDKSVSNNLNNNDLNLIST